MNKGDTVIIYEDPITCKESEGMAILINKIDENSCSETWKVHFLGDEVGCNYQRTIKKTKREATSKGG